MEVWTALGSSNDLKVLFVGLDAAGKTSLLYRLKLGEVVTTIPTIGPGTESEEFKFVCAANRFANNLSGQVIGALGGCTSKQPA